MAEVNFGNSEESANVSVADLQPGVIVDGWHFNPWIVDLVVQSVLHRPKDTVWVTGLDRTSGRLFQSVFRSTVKLDTWGTL